MAKKTMKKRYSARRRNKGMTRITRRTRRKVSNRKGSRRKVSRRKYHRKRTKRLKMRGGSTRSTEIDRLIREYGRLLLLKSTGDSGGDEAEAGLPLIARTPGGLSAADASRLRYLSGKIERYLQEADDTMTKRRREAIKAMGNTPQAPRGIMVPGMVPGMVSGRDTSEMPPSINEEVFISDDSTAEIGSPEMELPEMGSPEMEPRKVDIGEEERRSAVEEIQAASQVALPEVGDGEL